MDWEKEFEGKEFKSSDGKRSVTFSNIQMKGDQVYYSATLKGGEIKRLRILGFTVGLPPAQLKK